MRSPPSTPPSAVPLGGLLGACLLGVVLRVLLLIAHPSGLVYQDWFDQQDVVEAFARGELPAGAFVFPPGFAMIAAGLTPALGADLAVRALTLVAGIAVIPLTWAFARRWGAKVAFLATLLVAVDFGLTHWSVQVARTTLAACTLVGSLWAWSPPRGRELSLRRALLAGACTVIATLTRTEQVVVLALAVPLLLRASGSPLRRALPGLVILLVGLLSYAGLMRARTGVWGLSPNQGWTVAVYMHPDQREELDRVYNELVDPRSTRWEAFLRDPSAFQYPGLLETLLRDPSLLGLVGERLVSVLRAPQDYYTLHWRSPLATWGLLLAAALALIGGRGPARLGRLGVGVVAIFPLAFYPFTLPHARYFAPYVPALLTLAALGLRDGVRLALAQPPPRRRLASLLLLAAAVAIAHGYVTTHRTIERAAALGNTHPDPYQLAGEALRGRVPPGSAILSMTPQGPYSAKGRQLPFPRADLQAVVRYARLNGARALLYGPEERKRRQAVAILAEPDALPAGCGLRHLGTVSTLRGEVAAYAITPQ